MKNFFTALVLCFGVSVGAHAQTILNFDDVVLEGEMTTQIQMTAPSQASSLETEAMKTGANVSWDFSTVVDTGAVTESTSDFVDPSTTPYADDFPDATHAVTTDDMNYAYMILNNEKYESIGSGSDQAITKFTGFVNYTFPFEYEDEISGDYQIETIISGNAPIITSGTRTVTYSGYGTVKTKGGTFGDVIQTTTVQESGNENFSSTTTSVSFMTIDDGSVANYTKSVTTFTGGGSTSHSFSYNPNLPTARKSTSTPAVLSLYPNPTSGAVSLTYVQREAGASTIEVIDVLGRVVYSQSAEQNIGIQNASFNLEAPAGVYTLTVRSASGTTAQKLILN